jgi:hypothetical protein
VCTHDVVAACFNTGQVVGLQAGSDFKGPNVPVGDNLQTVARLGDVLLALDASQARRIRQVWLADYSRLPGEPPVGSAPNQLLVSDPYVYVLNSTDNTLLVLQRRAEPAPGPGKRFPSGLGLEAVGSVSFGAHANPFAMARLGDTLYVTLYGNLGGDPSAGGKVARVGLGDPARPVRLDPPLALPTGVALQPFPGRHPLPTPAGIVAHRGRLYATLNNLDPATYSPGGPGLLARIDPVTQGVDLLPLGEGCLNPGWVAPVGERLLVSCAGKATYDASFNLIGVEKTGLVLLGAGDEVLSTYALACPGGASDCPLPSAGRFAVVGRRVYLGDNNAGRLFVLEVVGDGLVERRGPGAGASLLVCPNPGGPSLVGDVVAIP